MSHHPQDPNGSATTHPGSPIPSASTTHPGSPLPSSYEGAPEGGAEVANAGGAGPAGVVAPAGSIAAGGSSTGPLPTSFSAGLRLALDGLELAFEDDGVHKAYFKVALTLLLLTTVLDGAGLWALWANTTPTPGSGGLAVLGLWLLRIVGSLVTLLIGPLVAVLTVNIVMPFFNQGVFLAGLRAADPARAQRLDGGPGMPALASAGGAVLRLLGFLGLSLCFLLLNLIPVIGSLLATVGQTWLTARTVAWELLDPYFDCIDMRVGEQRAFVKAHRKLLLGFGLPLSLMLAIPFLGPLAFGLIQAAAGTLVARGLPLHPRELR